MTLEELLALQGKQAQDPSPLKRPGSISLEDILAQAKAGEIPATAPPPRRDPRAAAFTPLSYLQERDAREVEAGARDEAITDPGLLKALLPPALTTATTVARGVGEQARPLLERLAPKYAEGLRTAAQLPRAAAETLRPVVSGEKGIFDPAAEAIDKLMRAREGAAGPAAAPAAGSEPEISEPVRKRVAARVVEGAPMEGKTPTDKVKEHIKEKYGVGGQKVERKSFLKDLLSNEDLGKTWSDVSQNIVRARLGQAPKWGDDKEKLSPEAAQALEVKFGLPAGSLAGQSADFLASLASPLATLEQTKTASEQKELDRDLKKAQLDWTKTTTLADKVKLQATALRNVSRDYATDAKELGKDLRNMAKVKAAFAAGTNPRKIAVGTTGLAGTFLKYSIAKLADSGGRLSDVDVKQYEGRPGAKGFIDRMHLFFRSRYSKEYYNNAYELVDAMEKFFAEERQGAIQTALGKAQAIYKDYNIPDERMLQAITGEGAEEGATVEVSEEKLKEMQAAGAGSAFEVVP